MLPDAKRSRPTQQGETAPSDQPASESIPSVSADPAALEAFRHSYAVLVRGKSVRRHLYFSLPAAARTVQRAKDCGDRADLVLVKLLPVDGRQLHQLDEQGSAG